MLQIDELLKRYQQHTAVNGISLRIAKGEFYGLLGPNGAGKTTTITMISGILPPDSGSIHVHGQNVYQSGPAVKQHMGIVPQEIALYDDLNALDNLLFWGKLYGVSGTAAKERAAHLLNWIGLDDRKHDLVKTYSGGMKRRVNIAASLMHNPEFVLMDEPTVGIDPQSRNKIYELLADLHAQGKTILYTTHYMQEAEAMCSKIGIIDKGKIIAEGTLSELKQTHVQMEKIVIRYQGDRPNDIKGYACTLDEEAQTISCVVQHTGAALHDIVQQLQHSKADVAHIDIQHAGLESIFLQLTGRQLRD